MHKQSLTVNRPMPTQPPSNGHLGNTLPPAFLLNMMLHGMGHLFGQLKHSCVTNVIFPTSLKHGTAMEKINFPTKLSTL